MKFIRKLLYLDDDCNKEQNGWTDYKERFYVKVIQGPGGLWLDNIIVISFLEDIIIDSSYRRKLGILFSEYLFPKKNLYNNENRRNLDTTNFKKEDHLIINSHLNQFDGFLIRIDFFKKTYDIEKKNDFQDLKKKFEKDKYYSIIIFDINNMIINIIILDKVNYYKYNESNTFDSLSMKIMYKELKEKKGIITIIDGKKEYEDEIFNKIYENGEYIPFYKRNEKYIKYYSKILFYRSYSYMILKNADKILKYKLNSKNNELMWINDERNGIIIEDNNKNDNFLSFSYFIEDIKKKRISFLGAINKKYRPCEKQIILSRITIEKNIYNLRLFDILWEYIKKDLLIYNKKNNIDKNHKKTIDNYEYIDVNGDLRISKFISLSD